MNVLNELRRASLLLLPLFLVAGGCEGKETNHPVAAQTKSAGSAAPATSAAGPTERASASIHDLTMKRLDGTPAPLSSWAGKVVLVVNTASECGYTPQYEGLESLHERYESKGFAVLGFPSNDFGGQEPGGAPEIATFCRTKYGIKFPMFDKVHTKGVERAELYARLTAALGEPKWNFHKYLVDKRGRPVKAFPSAVKPDAAELTRAIDDELAKP